MDRHRRRWIFRQVPKADEPVILCFTDDKSGTKYRECGVGGEDVMVGISGIEAHRWTEKRWDFDAPFPVFACVADLVSVSPSLTNSIIAHYGYIF